MNPTSLRAFTEGIFLLCRVSLVVLCPALPSGAWSLVSPCGKPLYSRHAEVPHEEQIHFCPEECHGGLWTSWICLLASGCHCCHKDQRRGSCNAGVA